MDQAEEGRIRTQVAIIGGGPTGLLLGQILHNHGIDNVILERQSRAHVLGRIRAGLLEPGFTDLLREAGVAAGLERDGLVHDGFTLAFDNQELRIDVRGLTNGCGLTVYGQAQVTRDLYEARDTTGRPIIHGVEDVRPLAQGGHAPYVTYRTNAGPQRIDCDFVAGCDGFHGICRTSLPVGTIDTHERLWPIGWLGMLVEAPPVADELVYAISAEGFALCSMRSRSISRYYVQCPPDTRIEDWPDDRFWTELGQRLPHTLKARLVTGRSLEKSVIRLRSFVAEPMSWGSLFLAGDAAHIFAPTGAKGLNVAGNDIRLLSEALIDWYRTGSRLGLEDYSKRALDRVWEAQWFSCWLTQLMHQFPDHGSFDYRMQRIELEQIARSKSAQKSFAEHYAGIACKPLRATKGFRPGV